MFDPRTRTWTRNASGLITPRVEFEALGLRGRFYVLAGNSCGRLLDRVEALDPSVNAWRDCAPLPQKLASPAVAACQGRLFVFGSRSELAEISRRTFIYDPAQNHWAPGPDFPELTDYPRAAPWGSAVALGDTIFLVARHSALRNDYFLYAYQAQRHAWISHGHIPISDETDWQKPHLVAWDHQVLVVPDRTINGRLPLLLYEPQDRRWHSSPPVPVSAHGYVSHQVAGDGSGFYLFGHSNEKSFADELHYVSLRWERGRAVSASPAAPKGGQEPEKMPTGEAKPRPDVTGPVVYQTSNRSLWLCDAEANKHARLIDTGDCSFPIWSPDGSRILFLRGDKEVWMTRPDGLELERVGVAPRPIFPPVWAGSNRFVAAFFVEGVTLCGFLEGGLRGEALREVWRPSDSNGPCWGFFYDYSPRSRLMALTAAEWNWTLAADLYVMDPATWRWTNLWWDPANDHEDFFPRWASRSDRIAWTHAVQNTLAPANHIVGIVDLSAPGREPQWIGTPNGDLELQDWTDTDQLLVLDRQTSPARLRILDDQGRLVREMPCPQPVVTARWRKFTSPR